VYTITGVVYTMRQLISMHGRNDSHMAVVKTCDYIYWQCNVTVVNLIDKAATLCNK